MDNNFPIEEQQGGNKALMIVVVIIVLLIIGGLYAINGANPSGEPAVSTSTPTGEEAVLETSPALDKIDESISDLEQDTVSGDLDQLDSEGNSL